MSVKIRATVGCGQKGTEHTVNFEMDETLYIHSSENAINNIIIIRLLTDHPYIDVGVDFDLSIEASARVAEAKETFEDYH